MEWEEIAGNLLLIPPQPTGIIHFLGGAFVGATPNITYSWLLAELAREGYAIVTTPFINTFDHTAIARDVLNRFETVLARLQDQNLLAKGYLPVYGIGHSMGCKLHLLIGSLFTVERAGNVLISFNNYPIRRSIPFLEQFDLTSALNVEFSPSPGETENLIAQQYQIRRNLLIRFHNDTIDQSTNLHPLVANRFPTMVSLLTLSGNHLTPLSQDFNWQAGEVFTPIDAVGQWLKQNLSKDLYQLKTEILRWLNPFS